MPPRSRRAALSDLIAEDLKRRRDPRLPSIRELAILHGAGRETIAAALGDLAARGTIERVDARTYRKAGAPGAADGARRPPEARRTAVGRTYDRIHQGIANGTYRVGFPLPKLLHFALELGISEHTAVAALRRLAEDGFVHRHGRSWFPGGRRAGKPPPRRRKTILLLMRKLTTWQAMNSSLRLRGFCMQFQLESTTHAHRLLPVGLEEAVSDPYVGGKAALLGLIKDLGPDLAGALLVGKTETLPDLPEWIRLLTKRGVPAVWLDENDAGFPGIGAQERRRWAGKRFTRCHWNEGAAVEAALDTLVENGHGRIGFARWEGEDWAERRLQLLLQVAQRRYPRIRILSQPECPFNHCRDVAVLAGRLRRLLRPDHAFGREWLAEARAKAGPLAADEDRFFTALAGDFMGPVGDSRFFSPQSRSIIAYLGQSLPLLERGATALMVSNHTHAIYFYHWLQSVGVKIPSQVSMLSFDNYHSGTLIYPITTVDFGFDTLGYYAFHALLGDIPLKRDRNGDIAASPRIVDGGSVLPAAPARP